MNCKRRKIILWVAFIALIIIVITAVLLFTQRCSDMRIAVFSPRSGMSVVVIERASENETTVSRSILYNEEQSEQKSMEDENEYPADFRACPPASITEVESPLRFQVVREETFEDVKDGTKRVTKIIVYGDGSVKRETGDYE